MQSKLLRIGSMSFAFAMLLAVGAPIARAEEAKSDDSGEESPKKRRKKAADEESSGGEAKPTDGGDEDGDKPKKKKRKHDDEGGDEAKPAAKPVVDDTAGLKEVGPDSYAATSPLGRVKIDRELPSEVGKFGWTWFGDFDYMGVGAGGTASNIKISMVGLRHWFSPKMGFEAATGLTVSKAGADGAPTLYCWGVQGGMLYSLARYEYVNVFAAGRAMIVPMCSPSGETTDTTGGQNITYSGQSIFQLGLSGEVAVEIFLDAFQIFHSGPTLKSSRSMSITLGSGLSLRYTKYGDITVTDNTTGVSNSAGATSTIGMNTTGVLSGGSSVFGSPTGSVAFTYYF